MKDDEKYIAKGRRHSFKIRAAGVQGFDFSDLGTVSIFHVTFSGPTGTQPGPTGDPGHRAPPRIHPGFRAARGVSCEHVRAVLLVGI